MTEFSGFPAEGLSFLADLGTKDRAWFDANRAAYQAGVVAPAKAFVKAMGESLSRRSFPLVEAQPKVNGSMTPINNDLRFSPDAPPYKDHLTFKFWEGAQKKVAPTLWVRLHPIDGIGFASGVVLADLDRWRRAVDEHGASLAGAISQLQADEGAELAAGGLKRVPKPFAADHPREELLRAKGFQVRWVIPVPVSIGIGGFIDDCVAELEKAADLHHWLVANVG